MLLSTVNTWGTQEYFSPGIDYSCPEWFRMFKSQVCLVSQLEVQNTYFLGALRESTVLCHLVNFPCY